MEIHTNTTNSKENSAHLKEKHFHTNKITQKKLPHSTVFDHLQHSCMPLPTATTVPQ